ncbi:MAG: penicillin-binding protein 2 [Treponemataceae bacterium]|nr:penicillin-binding protein 2 [Treponemataceae bacterium]
MPTIVKSDDFQNPKGDQPKRQSVLLGMIIMICVIVGWFVLHLFKMQVIEGSGYRQQSENISKRTKTLVAQRGEIFARDGDQPIVINVDSFAVDLIPGETGSKYDTVTAKLAVYLGIKKEDIDAKIPVGKRKEYYTETIKSNVTLDQIANIAENITDLPGVSWRSKPRRSYLATESMSHILGYVDDITKEELYVLHNQGYTSTSIIGKSGIEKQYDSLLQGKSGQEMRMVDAKGKSLSSTPIVEPPVMGDSLVLTIDSDIQKLAEETLGERVGSVVVLKPSNGEILAMASYPYYDSNIFSSENKNSEYAKLVNPANNNPLLNRAVSSTYPPASTFKVIMTAALLAEKTLSADSIINCSGSLDYGGRPWHCHKAEGHGDMDLKNGLAQSCNVYFWTIGRDYLGVDKISSYAQNFGYGKPLNIDLPSSSAGFVPTAVWKERRYHEEWFKGDTMNMSIGQGYTEVSPLHVADMMAMVVNEGVIYTPHFLKEVRDSATGEVKEVTEKVPLHTLELEDSVWKELKADLRYMVTDGSATYPLNNKIVQIAGKTGTGEISTYYSNNKQWHSWFVGYGPYDAPPEEAVVVVVSVEAVNVWEWWAPYASNIMFQGIFGHQTFDEAIDALGFRYLKRPVGRQE